MTPGPIILAGAVVGLAVMGDSLLYAVLPSRFAEFGVPAYLVGTLLGANRMVRIVFNAAAGRLYTRLGPEWPFFLGSVGATLTTAALALLPGFWALLAVRVAWGASWSLLRLGGYVVVLEHAGAHRGRSLGVFWSVVRAGMLAGTIGGAALADWIGLRLTLVLVAALTAISMALAAPRRRPGAAAGTPVTLAAAPLAPKRGREAAVGACVVLHAFVTQGLIAATLGFALLQRLGPQAHLGGQVLGIATFTGLLLGVQRVSELVLGPALGSAADRYGRAPVLFAGLGVGAAAALAMLGAPSPGAVGVAVLLYWLGAAAALMALDASAADLAHHADGARLLARYATWADAGAALGPVAGYALAAPFGVAALYLSATALLLACGALYAAAYRSPRTAVPALR